MAFPHNDMQALDRMLERARAGARQVLIAIEGHYSMDGDVPELGALVRLKRRYDAWLMVDEAHSAGVLGAAGRGIAEEQGVDPGDVDIWMGTLSKSFASSGGYIAGRRDLIDLLKYTSPGIVYSVGPSPAVAAAAHAAIRHMLDEPWRLRKLRDNGRLFLEAARERGLNTGCSIGASVVPIIVGDSLKAVTLSDRLFRRGINVQPILYPAVEERAARLRFDRGEDLGDPASVDEIRLALIDFDCQVSTDFATRWYPRLAALVASFRDEHIDLVTEQVDFAKAVNERCREILDTR